MERRRAERFPVEREVELTVLGEGTTSRTDEKRLVRMTNMSGRGCHVTTTAPLPPGTPVRIDLDDSILLGEVCFQKPEAGSFMCGIQLDQILSSVSSLARLVKAIAKESESTPSNERTSLRITR